MLNIPGHKGNANQNHLLLKWLPSKIQTKISVLERMWGKKNPHTLWWECKLVQPLWKTMWNLLKKLKLGLPYDPAILLLGIYPKGCKSGYSKGIYLHTHVYSALFTVLS
jgi:hypothetical protein